MIRSRVNEVIKQFVWTDVVLAQHKPLMRTKPLEGLVSWIRRKDFHVITVGKFTYTSDQRFQAVHMDNSDDWTLQIRYPQRRDAGIYECQVSTLPKMSLFVELNYTLIA
ncbi:unnamed protein product [Oppiella nova]|uniref:Ig-like domain-containing protein n=1 Tax=Oppiella nova TaxID=334625 RepID=A0A7R9LFR0_9ACAR|nr:unnamed protein product [Oppiella nova]CAG2162741.1 unnamed protein product [Oppiella nova]